MHKRTVAAAMAAAICTLCLTGFGGTDGKQSVAPKKVGIVQLVEHAALDASNKGICDALKDRGIDAVIDQQNAQADQSTLRNIAQRFVSGKSDIIFAIATPSAQVVANATRKIPIVATAVTDFKVARLVKSNDKPGTNVTGSSDLNPVAAQLQLLLDLVPGAKRIGTIYNSSEVNSQFQIDILKAEIAKRPGLKLEEVTISNVNDVQQAARSLVGKVDAIYVPTDNVVASAMPVLTKITNPAKLAVVTGAEGMMHAGGTATLGIDYYKLGRIAGEMGADILQGKSQPKDMPIRYQSEFTAKINAAAVKELGIAVPEKLARTAELVK
ncbi:MAG: ABC transporter substrate-binding protein [Duodenibacillus sp.]|nr:ABC transporter substrate-binding protein [Duodenibacillus sp.]